MLDHCLDDVLVNIKSLSIPSVLSASVCAYLETNRDRMDYKTYRKRGLLIGSGAIESAHRRVMQRRLKRGAARSVRATLEYSGCAACSKLARLPDEQPMEFGSSAD